MSSDHAYDALCDDLALTDPWDRDYRRPSDFPTASAFVRTASHPTVAATPAATRSAPSTTAAEHRHDPAGALSSASAGLATDLRRSGGGHRPSA